MSQPRAWIAIVGAGEATPDELARAEEAGAAVAEADAGLVCGGLGGVMEAACRGARSRGGLTLGLLPGTDRDAANGWVVVAAPARTTDLAAAPARTTDVAAALVRTTDISPARAGAGDTELSQTCAQI